MKGLLTYFTLNKRPSPPADRFYPKSETGSNINYLDMVQLFPAAVSVLVVSSKIIFNV
jgi:hypothetical protein